MGNMVPLRVESGERTYVFTQTEVRIGRDDEVDVLIDAPRVSRVHGIVTWLEDEWHYTDNSSRNGTFREGSRISEIAIDGPQTLQLAGKSGPEITIAPAVDLLTEPLAAMTLGRAPDNDIVVDDREVSRYHVRVTLAADGGIEITDLGSRNGTFVNGARVERATLDESDVVSVGSHEFQVVDGALEESAGI